MLNKFLPFVGTLLFLNTILSAQVTTDLNESVPLWLDYSDISSPTLNWISDDNANSYIINRSDDNFNSLTQVENIAGSSRTYSIGPLEPGTLYNYQITKDGNGKGLITIGLEIPSKVKRGRCIIAIDEILSMPLQSEIVRLMNDMTMDGWTVDTTSISREMEPPSIKALFQEWYDSNYNESQSILLLGHIPIPYSGNSAYDGHGNHQGAWVADSYYGDVDGAWTDQFINNTSPSRDANKNIPNDGKFDQSQLPSPIEIEIGRVDFHNLPAFEIDEIELTRLYLNKNHRYKHGQLDYPRRAFVDNNFAGFAEGFGQTGWKNFPTLFTADSVSVKNYDVLENDKYLCSYACGAGSYTSCGGVGNTQDVWVDRDNNTIFTFMFGSYFGDWDNTNNFLRAALASGDVLTNAWAGRPSWHMFPMALGKHIGYCGKLTQNASDQIFGQGFAAQTAHVSLLGDPTLRLHAMKPPENLQLNFTNGDVQLNWTESSDAENGYIIYRKTESSNWIVLAEYHSEDTFTDSCINPDNTYDYLVKALKLEHTGSGSYFNTSLGIQESIEILANPFIQSYYADLDGDGYGDQNDLRRECTQPVGYVVNDEDCDDTNSDIFPDAPEICDGLDNNCDAQIDEGLLLMFYADVDSDGFGDQNNIIEACTVPLGYTDNGMDCNDDNPEINPDAEDIPNNGIDEDCDGMDLVSSTQEILSSHISIYPNPAKDFINIESDSALKYSVNLYDQQGKIYMFSENSKIINLEFLPSGPYILEIIDLKTGLKKTDKIIVD